MIQNLVFKIKDLIERFAPSKEWYQLSMITLFEFGSEHVSDEILNNYLRVIIEAVESVENEGAAFGHLILEDCLGFLAKPHKSDTMVRLSA